MKRLQTTSDTHSFISSILITHLIGVTSRSNKHGTVSNHLNEIKYHLWLLLPLSMPIKDNYDIVTIIGHSCKNTKEAFDINEHRLKTQI